MISKHIRTNIIENLDNVKNITSKISENHSVMSDSLQPHGLYSPWNSPGQNTGVGSHSLLQGIFPTQGSNPGLLHCRWILYQLSHQGWRASPTRWTWVWVDSGSWWWTGRPGMLRFMGLQRVRHDWATELNWTELNWCVCVCVYIYIHTYGWEPNILFIQSCSHSFFQTPHSRQFWCTLSIHQWDSHAGFGLESKSGFIIYWFKDPGQVLSLSLIVLIHKTGIMPCWIGCC